MLQVLGRLHPVLVHFPIALLLAALVAELLRPRRAGPSEAGWFCLVLGTFGALAAALTGWLFAAHDTPGLPELLERHRWSGIGAAASATVTLVSAWRWRKSGAEALARPTRAGLWLTALLTGLSGHLGGSMVYGEGFALEPLRGSEPVAPLDETLEPPASEPVADTVSSAERLDFLVDVRPVLERRCFECHGDKKRPKGDLKLTDMAQVMARAADEAALVPGDPEASLLYRRIVLPAEHEDVMPPEEPLPAEEIALLRRWIAEGARWSVPPPAAGSDGG